MSSPATDLIPVSSVRSWSNKGSEAKILKHVNAARLKTLEAKAKIRGKENNILSTSFIILELSLQGKNTKLTCPTEADSYGCERV